MTTLQEERRTKSLERRVTLTLYLQRLRPLSPPRNAVRPENDAFARFNIYQSFSFVFFSRILFGWVVYFDLSFHPLYCCIILIARRLDRFLHDVTVFLLLISYALFSFLLVSYSFCSVLFFYIFNFLMHVFCRC